MRTLPRKDFGDVAGTMFLRARRPDDHREFDMLLPWLTPLFVYEMNGDDWVRWSMPKDVGSRFGLNGGCACCGKSYQTAEVCRAHRDPDCTRCDETVDDLWIHPSDLGDFHVDTALRETGWWLAANEYRVLQNATPGPMEKEGKK